MHLALLAVGLVAYWPLTSTRDSISGLDLTKVGKVQLTGHGADFRGGYLAQPNLSIGPDSYSVTMWANPDAGAQITLFSCGGLDAVARINSYPGETDLWFNNALNMGSKTYSSITDFIPGFTWGWHFYAFTYDASTLTARMYVDGQPTLTAIPFPYPRMTAQPPFLLGPSGFAGQMKNVGVWSVALPPEEVARQWNGGLGLSLGEL